MLSAPAICHAAVNAAVDAAVSAAVDAAVNAAVDAAVGEAVNAAVDAAVNAACCKSKHTSMSWFHLSSRSHVFKPGLPSSLCEMKAKYFLMFATARKARRELHSLVLVRSFSRAGL